MLLVCSIRFIQLTSRQSSKEDVLERCTTDDSFAVLVGSSCTPITYECNPNPPADTPRLGEESDPSNGLTTRSDPFPKVVLASAPVSRGNDDPASPAVLQSTQATPKTHIPQSNRERKDFILELMKQSLKVGDTWL